MSCGDHALVALGILRDMGLAKSKYRTLNFRRANFQLELVDETSWDTFLRNRVSDQSWQLFKDIFLRA